MSVASHIGFSAGGLDAASAAGMSNDTAVRITAMTTATPVQRSIHRQRSRPAADEMRPTRRPLTMSDAST